MTENLMTDEAYLVACGWIRRDDEYLEHRNYPSKWDDDGALDICESHDAILGRRVRETLILAGFGPDEPIPPPETLRKMVAAWRSEEILREGLRKMESMAARVIRLGVTPEVPKDGC